MTEKRPRGRPRIADPSPGALRMRKMYEKRRRRPSVKTAVPTVEAIRRGYMAHAKHKVKHEYAPMAEWGYSTYKHNGKTFHL